MCLRGLPVANPDGRSLYIRTIGSVIRDRKARLHRRVKQCQINARNFRLYRVFITFASVLPGRNNIAIKAVLPGISNGQLKEVTGISVEELTFIGHRRVVGLQVLGGHFDAPWKVLDVLHGCVHADVQSIGEGDRGGRVAILHWGREITREQRNPYQSSCTSRETGRRRLSGRMTLR